MILTKQYLHAIFQLIMLIHFSLLVTRNIHHIRQDEQEKSPLLANRYLGTYAKWTGIHGGYGFYSPSVGNSYTLQCQARRSETPQYPAYTLFKTATGRMRFHSLMDIGSSFLYPERVHSQYMAKTIVRHVQRLLKEQQQADILSVEIVSYLVPTLSQLHIDPQFQPAYLALYHYEPILSQSRPQQ